MISYVIYDEKAVWWVNAIALQTWILKSNISGEDLEVNIEAFRELARDSYTKARNDPWLPKL